MTTLLNSKWYQVANPKTVVRILCHGFSDQRQVVFECIEGDNAVELTSFHTPYRVWDEKSFLEDFKPAVPVKYAGMSPEGIVTPWTRERGIPPSGWSELAWNTDTGEVYRP